jgi:hypothetical protein
MSLCSCLDRTGNLHAPALRVGIGGSCLGAALGSRWRRCTARVPRRVSMRRALPRKHQKARLASKPRRVEAPHKRWSSQASIHALQAIGFSPLQSVRWLLRAARRAVRSNQRRLRARDGWHAAKLPLPEGFRAVGRQLRSLHRDLQQWARRGLHASALRGSRRKARLQDASRRIEGLLLFDLRQVVGTGHTRLARRPLPCARACPSRRAARSPR